MDILTYTSKVKTFSESELQTLLVNFQVSCKDLLANIENIKANNLDAEIEAAANSWVLTKALDKHLESKGFRSSTLLANLQFGIQAISTLIPGVEKLVRGYNTKIWDGKLVTLRQVNILNLIEHMDFWLNYTRNVFDVLLTINLNKVDPAKYLSAHDSKWMNGTLDFYKQFTVDLMKGSRVMIQTLEKIPDVEVSEVSLDVLESTSGKANIDVVGRGFGIHNINPLFWIGLGMKNINLARIDNMRDKNQSYAMKISQAINRRDGTNDPQIDRQIEIYQEKIARNEYTIEQIIKSYD